jgi:ABC-type microcin C transport system permease subunit YejE
MRKNVTVTKLRASSIGKLVGAIQGVWGFIAGIMISVFSLTDTNHTQQDVLDRLGIGASIAVFAFLLLPVVTFCIGWIQGVITAWIINLLLSGTGGIGLELEESVKK